MPLACVVFPACGGAHRLLLIGCLEGGEAFRQTRESAADQQPAAAVVLEGWWVEPHPSEWAGPRPSEWVESAETGVPTSTVLEGGATISCWG